MSIIELMVAMLLASLLTAGIVQIVISNSASFRLNEASARVQESGRTSLEILTRAVRNGGYFGCMPIDGMVNNLDENDADYDPALHDINAERAVTTEDLLDEQVAGTHNLRILGVGDPAGAGGETVEMRLDDVAESANFQVSSTAGVEDDDILYLTDCVGGDVIQVTNVNENTGVIVANTGQGSPGNQYNNGADGCNGNNCPSRIYSGGIRIQKVMANTYYVRERPDDGVPALYRQDIDGNSVEIVDGIADMRLQYGVASGDSVGDWKSPDDMSGSDWGQVVAVRISVLTQSPNDRVVREPMSYCFPGEPWEGQDCSDTSNVTEASDRRLYRVYTAMSSIRNRL